MFDFCPHCGQTIEVEQVIGQMLVCGQCGQDIGFVGAVQREIVSEANEQIRAGRAAVCPVCQQIVELRSSGTVKSFAAHYQASESKKICPGSGRPAPIEASPKPVPRATPSGKDLSAHMTRDVVKVLYCPRAGEPRVEMLTLDYLDKTERVRIQIEALREMMGTAFRMNDYPAEFKRPHLAVWASSDGCVIAEKHEKGGYRSIADAEILLILGEVRARPHLFFA